MNSTGNTNNNTKPQEHVNAAPTGQAPQRPAAGMQNRPPQTRPSPADQLKETSRPRQMYSDGLIIPGINSNYSGDDMQRKRIRNASIREDAEKRASASALKPSKKKRPGSPKGLPGQRISCII